MSIKGAIEQLKEECEKKLREQEKYQRDRICEERAKELVDRKRKEEEENAKEIMAAMEAREIANKIKIAAEFKAKLIAEESMKNMAQMSAKIMKCTNKEFTNLFNNREPQDSGHTEDAARYFLNIPNFRISKAEAVPTKKKSGFNYSFPVSAEELVDLSEIAKELSRERPCIYVRTKKQESPICNALLIHHGIINKAMSIGIEILDGMEFSQFGFYYIDICAIFNSSLSVSDDSIYHNLTPSEILSKAISWIKMVKRAKVDGILNTRIKGKKIQIDVMEVKI